jgi:hypothetical protein
MRRIITAAMAVALLAGACTDTSGEQGRGGRGPTDSEGRATTEPLATDGSATTERVVTEEPGVGDCDATDPGGCLLPWPNDRFTRADAATATGRRLDLPIEGMPTNASGVPIDPAEWNRNDGFSPASTLVTMVPGLDPVASKLAPVTDIGRSLDAGSSLVIVDVDTGERVAGWASWTSPRPSPRGLHC